MRRLGMSTAGSRPCQSGSLKCCAFHRSGSSSHSHRRKRMRVASLGEAPEVQEIELEADIKPYYRKFQSESEHLRDSIRAWQEISAEGVVLPESTTRSKLLYVLSYIKYTVVPEPIRYLWFLVWSAIRQAWYPWHKKAVLQGAKLDVWLQQKSANEQKASVSQSMALRRFHWHMTPYDDLVYRYGLIKAWLIAALARQKERRDAVAKDDPAIAPPPSII